MTNPLFSQNAFVTSSRSSKNAMHAVKNDTQVYYKGYAYRSYVVIPVETLACLCVPKFDVSVVWRWQEVITRIVEIAVLQQYNIILIQYYNDYKFLQTSFKIPQEL